MLNYAYKDTEDYALVPLNNYLTFESDCNCTLGMKCVLKKNRCNQEITEHEYFSLKENLGNYSL